MLAREGGQATKKPQRTSASLQWWGLKAVYLQHRKDVAVLGWNVRRLLTHTD